MPSDTADQTARRGDRRRSSLPPMSGRAWACGAGGGGGGRGGVRGRESGLVAAGRRHSGGPAGRVRRGSARRRLTVQTDVELEAAVLERVRAATDHVVLLEHDDLVPHLAQHAGRRQASESRANDDDVGVAVGLLEPLARSTHLQDRRVDVTPRWQPTPLHSDGETEEHYCKRNAQCDGDCHFARQRRRGGQAPERGHQRLD